MLIKAAPDEEPEEEVCASPMCLLIRIDSLSLSLSLSSSRRDGVVACPGILPCSLSLLQDRENYSGLKSRGNSCHQ